MCETQLVTPEIRRIRLNHLRFSIAATVVYVLLVFLISGWLGWKLPKSGWLLYVGAISPALPIAAVIYAMGRNLEREPDEFCRTIQVQAMLLGIGLTMVTCTIWGFLAAYAHVWERHVIMFVFPMWTGWVTVSVPIVKLRFR